MQSLDKTDLEQAACLTCLAVLQTFAGFSYIYALASCIAKRIRMKDDCALSELR